MRQGFGFNTDLFETNVLNLAVVVGIVVTVVGDAVQSLLDQRRQNILSTLAEADKKAREAQKRLEEAQKSVVSARYRAQEIRLQAIQAAERERIAIQDKLASDLQRLRDRGRQRTQLARQQTVQAMAQQVANLALTSAESTLLKAFGSQASSLSKQKELNEIHVRETLRTLNG